MNTVTDGNLLDLDNTCFSPSIQPDPARHRPEDIPPACSAHTRMIERARQRCISSGLPETAEALDAGFAIAPANPSLAARNRQLQAHALPVMELLAMQVAAIAGAAVLADADGTILHAVGDDDFLMQTRQAALCCGACWSEERRGTNAIGTALAERAPVSVRADEHYLRANRFLSGVAAPIFGHDGGVLGVLGLFGGRGSFRRQMPELVRMSAQMIENQLFSSLCRDALILHFSPRAECVGSLEEGIASFTRDGRFLSANRAGELHLGMPLPTLRTHTVGSLFGLPVSALIDHYRSAASALMELRLGGGGLLYGRPQLRLAIGTERGVERPPVPPRAGTGRMSGLRFLDTGDPQVAAVIAKLHRIAGCNIPILVNGETGTGKELLAHAVHEDSPRANGPFVAVNCASIPETLIESELFGYDDGAFTGARKKGSAGKILQADGGTLFLDEIGDMPLNLQARLLRVLQERRVMPLGSNKAIPVDVEVICATNRNLREMIARGEFREDLYYRLNGLVVKLPPARERTDLDVVIDKILRAEASEVRHTLAPDVVQLFKRHRWPGNFRQMRSVLRMAIIMAGDAREIRLEHLPDDFLDETAGAQAEAETREEMRMTQSAAGGNLEALEHAAIRSALEAHEGNVSAAARALGISRNTIYRKIGTLLK